MKSYDFNIKVADLLHDSWSTDIIEFVNKFSTRFPQLSDAWMNMSIEVLWLNDTDLTITVFDLIAPLELVCDFCSKNYSKKFILKEETIKASTDPTDEEILTIDKKNERIDLEWRITDILLLSLPVQCLCKTCEKRKKNLPQETPDFTPIQRKFSQK
jgi:hypothetical protein